MNFENKNRQSHFPRMLSLLIAAGPFLFSVLILFHNEIATAYTGPSCSSVFFQTTAQQVESRLSRITRLDQAARTDLKPLTEYNEISNGIYALKISNENAIAKSLAHRSGRPNLPLQEVYLMQLLADLGLGPKVFGISEIRGEPVVVSQFIEGKLYHNVADKWPFGKWGLKRKIETIESVARGLEELANLGVAAGDFQLLIENSGKAYFFDTDHYTLQPIEVAVKVNVSYLRELMTKAGIISIHDEIKIQSFEDAFRAIESVNK